MNLKNIDIKIGRSMRISVEKSAWNYVLDSVRHSEWNSVWWSVSYYVENSALDSVNDGLQRLIRQERK